MTISEGKMVDFSRFDAIGIGPGLGLDRADLLGQVLDSYQQPMVLDADALTLLSLNPELISKIPKGSILTPHLGEFERLFGTSKNQYERLEKASGFCVEVGLNIVIKGANSVLCLADGRQLFNSSGSNYMATAGMGDVLTGMLTSFLGQGYNPEQSMVCGVFQHGLAGEMAGKEKLRSTLASDLIEKIPETFKKLRVY
jgi:NAD(P)H-hydrate epimerase